MDLEKFKQKLSSENMTNIARLLVLGYGYCEFKESQLLTSSADEQNSEHSFRKYVPHNYFQALDELENIWIENEDLVESLELAIAQANLLSIDVKIMLLGCAIFIDEPDLLKDLIGYRSEGLQENFVYYQDLMQAFPEYYTETVREESISEKINLINDYINKRKVYEFRQETNFAMEGIPILTIMGSTDFSYYHTVEVIFKNTVFIQCPTSWERAWEDSSMIIRLATSEEQSRLTQQVNSLQLTKQQIFCVTVKELSLPNTENHYFIVASELEYSFDTVYHYKRESIGENERIAYWVK